MTLIGANIDAIRVGEDRELFKAAMDEIGIESPRGGFAHTWDEARAIVEDIGYPAIIRPSYTLGGTGGGTAFNPDELRTLPGRAGGLADQPDPGRGIDPRVEGV